MRTYFATDHRLVGKFAPDRARRQMESDASKVAAAITKGTGTLTSVTRDEVVGSVRRRWASVLDLPETEVDDSSEFFADGGDSLLAVELVVAVGEDLGVEVGLDALFLDGTFGALVSAAQAALADQP